MSGTQIRIARGMSQRSAIRAANDMGATVALVKRAEYGFSHPLMKKRIVTSAQRQDAALRLVVWLSRLEDKLNQSKEQGR